MKQRFANMLIVLLTALALTFSAVGVTPAHAAGSTAGSAAELIAAINAANASAADDVITLTANITLTEAYSGSANGLPMILASGGKLTIAGNGFKISRDASAGAFRILKMDYDTNLTLNNLTIENGYCSGCNGGAIEVDGGSALTITDSVLSGNKSDYGGALNVYEATLMMTNSNLTNNIAEFDGGGLYSSGSPGLTITGGVLSGNIANNGGSGRGGGAILVQYSTLNITGAVLSGNRISAFDSGGGGLYNGDGANATLTGVTFSDNFFAAEVVALGGGIYNHSGGTLTVTNGTFSGNSASTGGGVYNEGTATITDSVLLNNTAGYGGGIYTYNGDLTVMSSAITGNIATIKGGGINNDYGAVAEIINSTLSGNQAENGGGAIYNLQTVSIFNSTIANNTSPNTYAEKSGIWLDLGALNLSNSIVANNNGGNNFYNVRTGIFTSQGYNLSNNWNGLTTVASDLTGDPKLGDLSDNGGPTQTHALLDGSPAIDTGNNTVCAADPVNGKDQRGVTRPQGTVCDIGAYEYYVDTDFPSVSSITLADENPTVAASVNFTVTFSEPVANNVDTGDFTLTTAGGLSGASITGVSGTGSVRTVTVNRGTGDGTIRLNMPTGATVTDLFAKSLSGLPYNSGAYYTIITVGNPIRSLAKNDGWTLEAKEYANIANTKMSTGTLHVGDDAKKKQYRSLLYFDTAPLPNNAIITKVTLKIKKSGSTPGADPFSTHGDLIADMKKGVFGLSPLESSDFSALGAPISPATTGKFVPMLTPWDDWYQLKLSPANLKYINLLGATQFRLRFAKDDNNDSIANFVSFYSGDADEGLRPQLLIEYWTP